MATIFISHASANDALIDQIDSWLGENGFSDVFIDHKSIAGGEKWDDALARSAGACRVVICVITDDWLASLECYSEFRSARYSGKRILPLFLIRSPGDDATAEDRWRRVRADDQGLDLTPLLHNGALDFNADETAADELRRALRAAGASSKVGLDPEAFEIDKSLRASPFPGLTSFEDDDADAAIFYGRSREIALALERLRQSRASGDKTPLMILGASGSGKSSLLKAGVMPRLRREAPAWLPLRVFRPGADPLMNFADAFARTLADYGQAEAPGPIRRALWDAWRAAPKDEKGERSESGWRHLLETLNALGGRIRKAAARPEATLLLGVDQAEELARSEGDSGEALSDYLRATLLDDSPVDWRLAFTIRSDSLPELLKDPRFEGLDKNGVTLRALPVFRFDDVVEQPAKRYGVEIDHDLIDALMEDAPQSDALPLLAFAMQRLWRGFGGAGRIAKADYDHLGGLSGMLEDGAERALCGLSPSDDKPLPKTPPKAALTLGEETFVPALAQINDEGEAIRRVADWAEFSDEAKALLEKFDDWRLVVSKGAQASDQDGDTVEVAHEALFREWTRLKNWMEPERARLDALRGVHVAATVWERGGRKPAELTHFGQRLSQAQELTRLERYAVRLSEIDRNYIASAERAERSARRRRQSLQGAVGVFGVGVVAASLYLANQDAVDLWRVQTFQVDGSAAERALAAHEAGAAEPVPFNECQALGCPDMIVIPAGSARLGEHDDTLEVTIAEPFALGRTEVTFAQWDACVAFTVQYDVDPSAYGCSQVSDDEGWGRDDQPLVNVSWNMAQGYVRWLNVLARGDPEAGPYRLPSEVEWEYAARAGTKTRYHFGDDYADLSRYGWFDDNSDAGDGRRAQPVAQRLPNPFGLHDMLGNVWEWAQDCWNSSFNETPASGEAQTNGDCSSAVLRGGSWDNGLLSLRSANRLWNARGNRVYVFGFRVARTLVE